MESCVYPPATDPLRCCWGQDTRAESSVSSIVPPFLYDRRLIPSPRFRLVPTFGRDTIRRFSNNTSAMKKLAARDWEDMLQVALPVFEGLLARPYDTVVCDLLFTLCLWHAYAKLRLHTASTVDSLSAATTTLGAQLRNFQTRVCSHFETRELPREEAARGRRTAAMTARGGGTTGRAQSRARGGTSAQASSSSAANKPSAKKKVFNLMTYKLHALGDYVKAIMAFGPSDNYSTQTASMVHAIRLIPMC